MLALGLGIACRVFVPGPSEPPSVGPRPGRFRIDAGTIAAGLALWTALVFFAPSLMMPVKVVSDGPIYHLYFAARWWQAGRLELVPTPFGETAAPYFPANGDLWFAWLFVGWGGDRLAKVGQVPFMLLGASAGFALARRLGAGGSAARVATAMFVAIPPVVLFAMEANVDSIFGAGYVLSAYFAARKGLRDPGRGLAVLSGLAAGLALGTKATGVVFVPPLVVFGLGCVVRGEATAAGRWRAGSAYLIGMLATAGFWFLRDAWWTGNPLYPAHLEIGGITVLRGWFPRSSMARSPYYLPGHKGGLFVDMLLSVLDFRLAPFWVLSLFAWRIGARRRLEDGFVWAIVALAVVNLGLYWLAIPYRTQQRFLLHGLALGVVPLSRLLDRSRVLRWTAIGLLAVHLFAPAGWPWEEAPSVSGWWHGVEVGGFLPPPFGPVLPVRVSDPPRLAIDLATGLGAFALALLWVYAAIRPNLPRLLGASVATVGWIAIPAAWVGANTPRGLEKFPPFLDYYAAWQALDRLSPTRGVRVAYSGTNLPYYLMLNDFRNEVRYVNVDRHRDWAPHDYHRTAPSRGEPAVWENPRPGWGRLQPDREAWLANLDALGVEFLVVARANPNEGPFNVADGAGFPIERVWAESLPSRFVPVYGVSPPDPWMKIFRVVRTDRGSGRHV